MSFWYNAKHHFLFNHLPKCAGSSIRGHYHKGQGLWPRGQWEGPVLRWQNIPDHWPRDRSFAIIREPLERFVSAWKYTLPSLGFADAFAIAQADNLDPSNLSCPLSHALHHLLPQTDPYNRLDLVAHRVRFETLPMGLLPVLQALDLDTDKAGQFPHINRGAHRGLRDVPPDRLPELLDYLAEDYRQLDYPLPTL